MRLGRWWSAVILALVLLLEGVAGGHLLYPGLPAMAAVGSREEQPRVIQVKAGDTLSRIAAREGVDLELLAAANDLANPNTIYSGQYLVLPLNSNVVHVVERGDTLWALSQTHGVTVSTLMAYNHLANPDFLAVGQRLVIPGMKAVSAWRRQGNTPAGGEEQLRRPVKGAVLTSLFGERHGERHQGLDLAAAKGTPVRAAAGGRVVFAGWQRGYGEVVVVEHERGLATLYAHNSSLRVREDQLVEQGDTLALVGSSGDSTGPHLHFEVWRDGTPVDPLPFLFGGS